MRLLRAGDLLARFGGDEFVVVARDTDLEQAVSLGDRVRSGIESMQMSAGGNVVSITVSVGAASLAEIDPHRAAEALVELVDGRLGLAKFSGRNRVCAGDRSSGPPSPTSASRCGRGEGQGASHVAFVHTTDENPEAFRGRSAGSTIALIPTDTLWMPRKEVQPWLIASS